MTGCLILVGKNLLISFCNFKQLAKHVLYDKGEPKALLTASRDFIALFVSLSPNFMSYLLLICS